MQVSEVLERSLQTMEEEGWCKNAYANEDGGCVLWSLWQNISQIAEWQTGGQPIMDECLRALRGVTGVANIAYWQDHPDRTFSQVRETFRRAIAESELRERVAA